MNAELTAVLALIGLGISVWNAYLSTRKNSSDAVNRKVDWEVKQEGRITALEQTLKNMVPISDRVYALETKVGLFWHLVEEHMTNMLPHGNPIHLSVDEQAYARVYNTYKARTPTHVLKVLAPAITRELRVVGKDGKHEYMSADEVVAFTCILGAIKSQLFDRGEWRPEDDQRD